jgi:AcrR family transcriptional regulator
MAVEPPAHRGGVRLSRAERAEQLLDVTLELIAERGYRSVSVGAIAGAAGTTKPIIYRIYPSRHALLLALYRREQQRIDSALDLIIPRQPGERHPREVLADGLTGILAAVDEHPLTWRLALYPSEGTPAPLRVLVDRRRAGFIKRAQALVVWGLPWLDLTDVPDPEILARVLVTWAEEHARILLDDRSLTPQELLASARVILDAIVWRDAPQRA